MRLAIPNKEIKEIFIEKIQKWFSDKVSRQNRDELNALCTAILEGDCPAIETIIGKQLRSSISYHDAYEGYYHSFLTGLLKGCAPWGVTSGTAVLSNRESGDGRSDILIVAGDGDTGILIEVKAAGSLESLSAKCQEALEQIEQKSYTDVFLERGITEIKKYGIAFWKKRCGVAGP